MHNKYFVCLFFFFVVFWTYILIYSMLQRWTRPSPAVCWIALLLYVLCIFVWHDLCANWYLFSIFFFKFAFTIWINSIQPKCRGWNFDLLNTCEWITVTCQCSIKQSLPRLDVLSTNIDHNKRLSHRIYWMVTANSLCVTTWRLVACTETGCGIDVERFLCCL